MRRLDPVKDPHKLRFVSLCATGLVSLYPLLLMVCAELCLFVFFVSFEIALEIQVFQCCKIVWKAQLLTKIGVKGQCETKLTQVVRGHWPKVADRKI